MWRMGILNSYTMESTFSGSTLGKVLDSLLSLPKIGLDIISHNMVQLYVEIPFCIVKNVF